MEQQGLPADPDAPFAAALGDVPAELALAAAPVVAAEEHLFRVDPERGRWAVLQLVQDAEDGDLIDLIAWHPARPGRWRFLNGSGCLLGAINVEIDRGSVRVYATPLSWLQAEGDGICLLRRDRATVLRHLLFADRLVVDDDHLFDWVNRMLRDPGRIPAVRLALGGRAA